MQGAPKSLDVRSHQAQLHDAAPNAADAAPSSPIEPALVTTLACLQATLCTVPGISVCPTSSETLRRIARHCWEFRRRKGIPARWRRRERGLSRAPLLRHVPALGLLELAHNLQGQGDLYVSVPSCNTEYPGFTHSE